MEEAVDDDLEYAVVTVVRKLSFFGVLFSLMSVFTNDVIIVCSI